MDGSKEMGKKTLRLCPHRSSFYQHVEHVLRRYLTNCPVLVYGAALRLWRCCKRLVELTVLPEAAAQLDAFLGATTFQNIPHC